MITKPRLTRENRTPFSAAPGIRTLNPVKGDGFQDRFLTNSDEQHMRTGLVPAAASFYIYNGAETITISVSPTVHLSQLSLRTFNGY